MKVNARVHVRGERGQESWLNPGDTVPEWATVTNPDVLEDEADEAPADDDEAPADEPEAPADEEPEAPADEAPAPAPRKRQPRKAADSE